jgi:alpha-N-arabinofuranosidase
MSQWVEYLNFDGRSPMADLRRENGRNEPWDVSFWGVGNESWGCGGHMRPEFYADQYRRFACYCRTYGENVLYKVACGPNGDDYEWTDVLMKRAGNRMNALAMHYYTGMGPERPRPPATPFDEDAWFRLLKRSLFMEELIVKHSAIMDRYDPDGNVALIVDEWGTWHGVEEGTNPRFLHQQNALRDALVAGLTLNIFNRYCKRLKMCNIAQTINVLQAMILTEGPEMLLTPTYHVFDMYKVHHGATMVPVNLSTGDYVLGEDSMPALSASASRDKQGKLHLTVCNTDPGNDADVEIKVRGFGVNVVSGRVLTAGDMTAHNTFDNAARVKPVTFDGARADQGTVRASLPSKSVVVLEMT